MYRFSKLSSNTNAVSMLLWFLYELATRFYSMTASVNLLVTYSTKNTTPLLSFQFHKIKTSTTRLQP